MELQRILAKDTRSAMEQIHNLFGSDALVVSNKKARGKTEVIVAIDIAADKNNAMAELQVAAKEVPRFSLTVLTSRNYGNQCIYASITNLITKQIFTSF